MRSFCEGTGQASVGVESQGMNVKRMTRGDGWIVLLIAAFVLCAILGMGAWAQNRPCEDVADSYGNAYVMCKDQRLD
jgi:hypothetical protein